MGCGVARNVAILFVIMKASNIFIKDEIAEIKPIIDAIKGELLMVVDKTTGRIIYKKTPYPQEAGKGM